MKFLILGGPLSGKTTLSEQLSKQHKMPVRHTDDLIATHAWGEDSTEVAKWLSQPGDCIIEGVSTVRALRKALAAGADLSDVTVVRLQRHSSAISPKHAAMTKACDTIFSEIEPSLVKRCSSVRRWSDASYATASWLSKNADKK